MDDESSRQTTRRCDGSPARPNRAVLGDPFVRLGLNFLTAFPNEGSSDAAAVLKMLVGGVDDCGHRLGREVPLDDFDHLRILPVEGLASRRDVRRSDGFRVVRGPDVCRPGVG